MSPSRVSLRIEGKVQGVFYRQSALDKAAELGLTGWVKNLPDGAVASVAEGDDSALESFIAWCRQGPQHAHVRAVDVQRAPATGEFSSFRVIR